MAEDWKAAWQPMIDAVGKDFSDGKPIEGADVVEKGLIRRYLEPLEFDCALHYDEETAKQHGYKTIIAPYSSLITWAQPAYWIPGKPLFTSDDRDAQPTNSPVSDPAANIELMPETSHYFATNIEVDYLRPIYVGDRLSKVGLILRSCIPKETSVGKGAFMIWESDIVNQDGEKVAVYRIETYNYNPHES